MQNFPRLVLHAALWAIPALALWLYLLQPVLLPFFTAVNNRLLQATFPRTIPELELKAGLEWHIHTKIMLTEQVPGKVRILSMNLGTINNVTLGLPLLWALLLAIPHRRGRNLLLGSLLVAGLTAFALWLRICFRLSELLSNGESHVVFISQGIQQQLAPLPTWLPDVLNTSHSLLTYLAAVIVPAALAYWLNRSWWLHRIQAPAPSIRAASIAGRSL